MREKRAIKTSCSAGFLFFSYFLFIFFSPIPGRLRPKPYSANSVFPITVPHPPVAKPPPVHRPSPPATLAAHLPPSPPPQSEMSVSVCPAKVRPSLPRRRSSSPPPRPPCPGSPAPCPPCPGCMPPACRPARSERARSRCPPERPAVGSRLLFATQER